MKATSRPTVTYDVKRVVEDMVAHGWNAAALADAAGLTEARVSRFLNGVHQTPKTAAKIASALGKSPRDYASVACADAGAAA